MYLYLGFALLGGFLLANQNPINADLRRIVGSPFLASGISNFVGSVFLGVITLVTTQTLFPSWVFVSSYPAWIWLGGLLGGIFLTSNVLLFPRLGAVQTVILPILGQILMGSLIDNFGWFGAMHLPLSLIRAVGIVITLLGVIIAVVLPSLKEKDQAKKPKRQQTYWGGASGQSRLERCQLRNRLSMVDWVFYCIIQRRLLLSHFSLVF